MAKIDQKGRTGRLEPSYGDVSTTGKTGPKAAPNLGIKSGASVLPRLTAKQKRSKNMPGVVRLREKKTGKISHVSPNRVHRMIADGNYEKVS